MAVDTIEVSYESKRVERCFQDYEIIARKIGRELAKGLKNRMNHVQAAESFQEYLKLGLGKPHGLSGNLHGSYGVTITGNVRLIMIPKTSALDPVSLGQCRHVIVKGVCDYHDGKNEWIIP